MNDKTLVERLKNCGTNSYDRVLCQQAAEEIERLGAHILALIKTKDMQREVLDLLKEEVEGNEKHRRNILELENKRAEEHRRDMFACAALPSLMLSDREYTQDEATEFAYEYADKMLKWREE